MINRSLGRILVLAFIAMCGGSAFADEPAIDYSRDIKPILAEKCVACHGRLKQQSRLRLDAAPLIAKGGRRGPVVVPGKAAESELIRRVIGLDADDLMPPPGEGERLLPEQVAKLKTWINQGAKMPDEPIPPDPARHWAYQRPVKAEVPGSSPHPIDGFLTKTQAAHGVTPAGPAARNVLLRRVSFDLIGLPPTPADVDQFVSDDSPDAYEKVVDRLLSSPQYGERWARHWMDVWRYSDMAGQGRPGRDSAQYFWRWRDWIVESINEDKGYDRMILEMLAADELFPDDERSLRGGGFLARNQFRSNRNLWLDATVEHTMKAFVGVTIDCCKCHDHKFDPIGQDAYFQIRAFFEPHNIRKERLPGKADSVHDGVLRPYDADADAPTYLLRRGDEQQPDKSRVIRAGVPPALGGTLPKIEPVALPVLAYYPHLKDSAVQAALQDAQSATDKAENESRSGRPLAALKLAEARAAHAALEARVAADRAKYFPDSGDARPLAERALKLERRHTLAQAELALEIARNPDAAPEKKVGRGKKALTPEAAKAKLVAARADLDKPGDYTPLGTEYDRQSTGRRRALAQWIAAGDNPLTARVAVNHIWMRHFGAPLVESVFDFGLRCPPPRHVELLDWLAIDFVENGWSMKKLHRLIVTSEAYRRASSTDAANHRRDPDNHFYGRMNPRRLEAEAVRDSVLSAAGVLDLAIGGPDIANDQGETIKRRSLYFRHAYQSKMKFLELFDGPSESECYRRSESVVPQQSLALANSLLTVEQARLLAREMARPSATANDPDAAFITLAFRQLLSRPPSADEDRLCREFLVRQAKMLSEPEKLTPSTSPIDASVSPASDPALRARENLVQVLLNHNDFITVR